MQEEAGLPVLKIFFQVVIASHHRLVLGGLVSRCVIGWCGYLNGADKVAGFCE
jgi:hypothetical protein